MHRRQSHWGAAICRSLYGDSPGAATSVSHLSTKRTTHARDARALCRPPEGGSTMFYTSHSSGFSEITGNQMHRGLCAPGFGHSAHAGIPSFQHFLSNGLGSSTFSNKGRCREGCQASATCRGGGSLLIARTGPPASCPHPPPLQLHRINHRCLLVTRRPPRMQCFLAERAHTCVCTTDSGAPGSPAPAQSL